MGSSCCDHSDQIFELFPASDRRRILHILMNPPVARHIPISQYSVSKAKAELMGKNQERDPRSFVDHRHLVAIAENIYSSNYQLLVECTSIAMYISLRLTHTHTHTHRPCYQYRT